MQINHTCDSPHCFNPLTTKGPPDLTPKPGFAALRLITRVAGNRRRVYVLVSSDLELCKQCYVVVSVGGDKKKYSWGQWLAFGEHCRSIELCRFPNSLSDVFCFRVASGTPLERLSKA